MSGFSELEKYVEEDLEKLRLLDEAPRIAFKTNELRSIRLDQRLEHSFKEEISEDVCCSMDVSLDKLMPAGKFCPECGREFSDRENFCPDCLVTLKEIKDEADIKRIKTDFIISFAGKNDCQNILNPECFKLINDFDFGMADFNEILFSIKSQAFKNMDKLIKDYSIDLEDLDVLDKVILFAKSFASVEYKSYGQTLGYFELNKIYIDDRQPDSLQITTIIHELTHFLIKEILIGIICKILDSNKNKHIESVVTYILNYSKLNRLIDEYAAHSVEGRFTVFGYQDYSSFVALLDGMDEEYVEMAKTIGNTFSIHIKNMLEGFLDWDVRSEIKELFLSQTTERPTYEQLKFENSSKLTDEGFIKAIWLVLGDIENADEKKVRDLELEF
ncbi:MAG: hypothetical protein ACSW71_05500 [Methanobrevibacter sp.]